MQSLLAVCNAVEMMPGSRQAELSGPDSAALDQVAWLVVCIQGHSVLRSGSKWKTPGYGDR